MASKSEYIERLQLAIANLHNCDSQHVSTVAVREMFQELVIWEGDVEVFELRNHPRAKKAYAWSCNDDIGGEHMTAVLELPPVKSPLDAVRASIMSKHHRQRL